MDSRHRRGPFCSSRPTSVRSKELRIQRVYDMERDTPRCPRFLLPFRASQMAWMPFFPNSSLPSRSSLVSEWLARTMPAVLAGLVAQVRTSTSRAQCRDAIVKSGIVTMVRSRFYRSRFYRSRFYRSRFHRSRFSSHGRTRRVCSMIEARVEILHYLPVAFHGFLSLKKGAR